MSKLWGGRFTKNTDIMVEEFTSSISFDQRMYAEDTKANKNIKNLGSYSIWDKESAYKSRYM